MSRFIKAAPLAFVAGAVAVLSGCQDATAPASHSEASLSTARVSASSSSRAERELIKDQYIVVFRDGENDVDGRSRKLMAGTKGKIKNTYEKGLKGFAAGMTAAEAAAIAKDPSVAYVEQDQLVALSVGKPDGSSPVKGGNGGGGKGGKTTQSPVDTGTVTQLNVPSWGIDRIDQASATLNTSYVYSARGIAVHAYIIDTGIRATHSEFGGRATAEVSFINDSYGPAGCNWHGTHVAGTVGGATAGVAKKVMLHSVRVLDCNASGTISGVAAGIDWVVANRIMPAVINISITAPVSQVLADAVDRAVASGITVVVAAGNSATDACGYSPANTPSAITVGAVSKGDLLSSFSNQGSCVDLFAPGEQISSAMNWDDTSLEWGSGTSMAAPHVAGAAALYLEANPAASPSMVAQDILQRAIPGLITGIGGTTPNLILSTR